jgi:hypothetical protein
MLSKALHPAQDDVYIPMRKKKGSKRFMKPECIRVGLNRPRVFNCLDSWRARVKNIYGNLISSVAPKVAPAAASGPGEVAELLRLSAAG